jgi:alkylated DNA repair dioxygenase AlkB
VVAPLQLSLLGAAAPSVDVAFGRARRIELGAGAWVEHVHGWISGAEALFVELEAAMQWRADRRVMYDRVVDVPRLRASVPKDGAGHPLLTSMNDLLSARYAAPFDAITLALYRNGADSVAWHRDRYHRDRVTSVVAVASLGGPRKFAVRPRSRASGTRSLALTIASGDLVVMGGTCQRTVEHTVPKMREAATRIAIMFRHDAPISPACVDDPA